MATRKKMPDVMGELLKGPTGAPVNQKAGKTEKQNTGILVNQPTDEKVKATYYLSQHTVDSLEEAKLKLRRMADKDKRQISISAIVDVALQMALAELETEGEKSQLAGILVNQ